MRGGEPLAAVRRQTPAIAARFLLAVLLLGTVFINQQDRLIKGSLPGIAVYLDAVDDTFRTLSLRLVETGGERLIERRATPARSHVVGASVIYPDSRTVVTASLAPGLLFLPLVIGIPLVVAWPWRTLRQLALRIAIAAPLLLLVVLADAPLLLYALLWKLELDAVAPEQHSLLLSWTDFMNAGGRYALAAGVAAFSIRISSYRERPCPP